MCEEAHISINQTIPGHIPSRETQKWVGFSQPKITLDITGSGTPPPSQVTEFSKNHYEQEGSRTFVEIRQPTISRSKDLDFVRIVDATEPYQVKTRIGEPSTTNTFKVKLY